MFSLQKLFGKDDKFFTLMESSAEQTRASIQSVIQLVKAAPEKRSSMASSIHAARTSASPRN